MFPNNNGTSNRCVEPKNIININSSISNTSRRMQLPSNIADVETGRGVRELPCQFKLKHGNLRPTSLRVGLCQLLPKGKLAHSKSWF
jgi:hypothetical protein